MRFCIVLLSSGRSYYKSNYIIVLIGLYCGTLASRDSWSCDDGLQLSLESTTLYKQNYTL